MSDQQAQNPKPRGLTPLVALLALGGMGVALVLVALAYISRDTRSDLTAQDGDSPAIVGDDMFSSGVNEVEPLPVTSFVLTRTDGTPLTLDDLKGDYSVLYFGYTYCPDFCPSTMTDWRLIRRGLGELADDVNFVMISVDPARDTPEVLARYLNGFDPAIIGATGDDETLRRLAEELGAFYETVAQSDTPLYLVNHTASQFVLDPEGNLVTVYTFATPIDVISADLRKKLGA